MVPGSSTRSRSTAPGTISDGRVLVEVPEDVGSPDGMTVDATGDLWVAIYGGGRVHRYSPDGRFREALEVPAEQTTCCAFAGSRGCTSLYVTTATENWSDDERRADPMRRRVEGRAGPGGRECHEDGPRA